MPIYEFLCKACDEKFEEICKMDTKTAKCPKCGKASEKMLSMFAFSSQGKSSAHQDGCGGCTSHNCGTCASGACGH